MGKKFFAKSAFKSATAATRNTYGGEKERSKERQRDRDRERERERERRGTRMLFAKMFQPFVGGKYAKMLIMYTS